MSFNIVHHLGEVKKATTLANKPIVREEQFFIPEWGVFVQAAPYDNHFTYCDPTNHGSTYLCTCGSVAVVVPPGPSGMMICLFDATYGFHQTTVINTKDRDEYRGETIEIAGKRSKIR